MESAIVGAGAPALAHQGCLFEGDEYGAHAGHVLGLLVGFGVEVAEPCHPLPLGTGSVLVTLLQEGFFRRPAGMRRKKTRLLEENARSFNNTLDSKDNGLGTDY